MHVYTRPFDGAARSCAASSRDRMTAFTDPGASPRMTKLLQIPNQVRDDGLRGAGGLGTLCGIQGVELFFGDGGVLVVGFFCAFDEFFGPELA